MALTSVSLALGVTLTGCSDDAGRDTAGRREKSCVGSDRQSNSETCADARFLLAIEQGEASGLNDAKPGRLIEFGRGACAFARMIATNPELAPPDYDSFRASTAGLWGVEPGSVDAIVEAMPALCPTDSKGLADLRSGS